MSEVTIVTCLGAISFLWMRRSNWLAPGLN